MLPTTLINSLGSVSLVHKTDHVYWARGIDMPFVPLGMTSPFIFSGIGALDSDRLMADMAQCQQRTWDGIHVSPRTDPSE